MATPFVKPLQTPLITPEAFQLYGQVIYATEDSHRYSSADAQLKLDNGIPRFYIMRLFQKGLTFSKITRHLKCTQCLGSLEGKPWVIAVAPPSEAAQPALVDIAAFVIPGNCFIKLHRGTWHAGPYFEHDFVDFYNLELTDTNINDHDTYDLLVSHSLKFELVL
ncbi:MAG TPA: ureidoglycolate lyase [Candidatus Caenarcaniphilales bacterium]